MKDLIFLPDREGRDVLTSATGFVRLGADGDALRDLADRLVVRGAAAAQADEDAWRGMLALALLADVWAEADAKVSVMTIDGATSLFASWVLAARPASARRDAVHLVLLESAGQRRLLGIADPECGLILPATKSDLTGMLPGRVRWIEGDVAGDPIPYLSEMDRNILRKRMRLLGLSGERAERFDREIDQAHARAEEAVRQEDEEALRRLTIRMQAVAGLKEFASFRAETAAYAFHGENGLMACVAKTDITGKDLVGENTTYFWGGVAFACTDSRIGLTDTCDPAQFDALNAMAAEIGMMSEQSASWSRRAGRDLAEWLLAHRVGLIPAARAHLEDLRRQLDEAGCQVQGTVTLNWPWDASSGAVRALLTESLGEGWMEAAAAPFSDRLTKLTGHVLGDMALQTCCACADGVLLPPLSRTMASCVARAKDGEGLALDAMRFIPREDGGITASFLLRGAGEAQLTRTYSPDEITVLAEDETPAIAVWPCVPTDAWRAFHVFTRGGNVQTEVLREGSWLPCPTSREGWNCLCTPNYPACLMLTRGAETLGALPNLLPECPVLAEKEAVAAIDLGTATTAVALTLDGQMVPIEAQPLTRLLVMPDQMPADDLLLSLTPTATVPTAVELTGPGTTLFVDGHVLCSEGIEKLAQKDAASIKSALKWRADGASVRARRLLLQQVMQGTSFAAVMAGAKSITWRVTVADEMDDEGRQVTLNMMDELAETIADRTGLPLTEGKPAVTWAEEAAALCAYLRGPGDVRGTFTALDMGSGSTKLHLWMQGQSRPTAGSVLLDGTQAMLLASLRARPSMLAYDFADCPDEAVQDAMMALEEQLTSAEGTLAEGDKAQLMLRSILETYRQPIVQHLYARSAAQRPTYMQAVLLENQAAMMFVAGLMLEQAGSDTLRSHLLPEDMVIALTGRGAWLLDTLTPAQRNALQQIARRVMRMDNPIRFITLKAAPQPDMSVAAGMTLLRETGVTLDALQIRTRDSFSQLMKDLMIALAAHYPLHTWLLHEGLFDQWGQLTPAGDETISRLATRCYGAGEDIPASVIAFIKALRMTAIPQTFDHAPISSI